MRFLFLLLISVSCFGQGSTITVSGTNTGDQTSVTGNAGTATALQTGRTINGITFDGTGNITITASGSTLTGSSLAAGITSSSLTSFGSNIILGTPASGTLTNCTFPTLNQSTTGSAASLTTSRSLYGNNFNGTADISSIIASTYGGTGNGFTKFSGPTTSEKTFTLPDASATLLYSGGALGTPSSGTLTNCTFPTLNQNTTGSSAKWTTARNLAGNSVDGSANVTFSNAFIVQGTVDSGLSGAQFLGSLGTGILKNTTTTGILSIAVAGDFPTLNQNTTGSAATLTTSRNINGTAFNGSADITITAAAGTLTGATLASGVTASSLTSFGSTPTIVTPSFTTGFTIGGVAASGTILRGNGTNFVASSLTLPNTTVTGEILVSTGTNTVSSINTRQNWTTFVVSGSNATTTGQSLIDITGLVSGTLTNSTLYEVEAYLYVTTTAVTTGTQYGIFTAGSGGAGVVEALMMGTTTTNATTAVTLSASGTAAGTFLTTSSSSGVIYIHGFVTTRGSGTATISIQHLKVTSGTSTVNIGSKMSIRLAN